MRTAGPVPQPSCPVCGQSVEQVTIQAGRIITEPLGTYVLRGGDPTPPYTGAPREEKPWPGGDQITASPCGDELTREQLEVMVAQAIRTQRERDA